MSKIIELRVAMFVSQYATWEAKLAKRHQQGKELDRRQRDSYNAWRQSCTQKLVFSRTKETFVTEAREVDHNCFAIELCLSELAEQLEVCSGDGTRYRLVLLRGNYTIAVASFDNEAPVPQDVLDQLDVCDEGEDLEDLGQEAQDALQDAARAAFDAQESMVEEVLGETDDELPVLGITASAAQVVKVKNFHHRPAWKELDEAGLCVLPRHVKGVSLGHHNLSFTWQGFYPGVNTGLTLAYGRKSKRTEREALLGVLRNLIAAHVEANPKDAIWKMQLEKIKHYQATC